jgi:hypothetical protein
MAAGSTRAAGGLKALAAGLLSFINPATIAMSVIAGLVAMWSKHKAAIEASMAVASENEKVFNGSSKATQDLTEKTEDYLDRLRDLKEENDALATSLDATRKRILDQAEAQDRLTKSQIDGRVARGEITKEEGDALKGNVDVESLRRRDAAAIESGRTGKAVASAELRQAREAEAAAVAAVTGAQGRASQSSQAGDRFIRRGISLSTRIRSINENGSNEDALRANFDPGELERRVRATPDFGGDQSKWLDSGMSAEQLVSQNPFLRDKIAEQLAKESDLAVEAVKRREEQAKADAAIVAEKQKELEAIRKAREAAEKAVAAAEARLVQAQSNAQLTEAYEIPRMEQEQQNARDAAATAERNRVDEDAKRKAQSGINSDAGALAQQIQGMVASAPNPQGDPALISTLSSIAKILEGGLQQEEIPMLQSLMQMVDSLTTNYTATRAQMTTMAAEMSRLAARVNDLSTNR